MKQMLVIIALVSLCIPAWCLQDFYVDAVYGSDSTGTGAQLNPWQTITYALSQVTGTQINPAIIHIAAGTYDANLGEMFPLEMEDYVSLSGASSSTCIIDADGASESVIECIGADDISIGRLTITNGSGKNISSVYYGGGFYISNSNPYITNCEINENEADYGGGIYFTGSQELEMMYVNFTGNTATTGSGGGIYFDGANAGDLTIEEVDFFENEAYILSGGAIYIEDGVDTAFLRGVGFLMSSATGNTNSVGGAIAAYCDNLIIDHCYFGYNSSYFGGGVYIDGEVEDYIIDTSVFFCNSAADQGGGLWDESQYDNELFNCLFDNNMAINEGGGIWTNGIVEIQNCTIADNVSIGNTTGGLYVYDYGSESITVKDSIIWSNTGGQIGGAGSISVTYSDVDGGYSGTGNINSNPIFATGAPVDFYLSQTDAGQMEDSPCVDAGSNLASNISGYRASLDELTTRTDLETDTGIVDMGYHSRVD